VVIRYYIAAAGFLVIGCTLAGFLTVAMFDVGAPSWILTARENLTLAHVLVNVGGWVGLSIAGTLVTLGPTMLRTRMDPAAADRAVAALPGLVSAIAVAGGSAAAGFMPGVGVALLAFMVASFLGIGLPLARTVRARSPHDYATWAAAAGLGWTMVGVGVIAFLAFTAPDAAALSNAELPWLALVGAGGLVQVLFGTLTYLLPVVVGGGPRVVRVGIAVLETVAPFRIVLRNTAVALLAVTAVRDTALQTVWWAVVLVSYVADIALLSLAGVRQAKAWNKGDFHD
jgi:nitrite reductase (NO-forming)